MAGAKILLARETIFLNFILNLSIFFTNSLKIIEIQVIWLKTFRTFLILH